MIDSEDFAIVDAFVKVVADAKAYHAFLRSLRGWFFADYGLTLTYVEDDKVWRVFTKSHALVVEGKLIECIQHVVGLPTVNE